MERDGAVRGEVIPASICCAALLLFLLIARPFVNSPFNDDWSYSHVALKLAETGHFHYNGWGSPTIVFQSLWGALFIRLFGFSFNVLRLATLPFSLGLVALTYLLGRRAGLRRQFAMLGALSLAASPLFMPLAASFMTEPYSCFFSMLCVYAAVCSAEAQDRRSAIVWLAVLAFSGILGGSNRQTVWAAPFILIPYLAWARRRDRLFLRTAGLSFAVVVGALLLVIANFSQKYSPMEMSKFRLLRIAYNNGYTSLHLLESLLLTCMLMSLPALLSFRPQWKRIPILHFLGLLLFSFILFDYCRSGLGNWGLVPFSGNILMLRGIMDRWNNGLGYRPVLFGSLTSYILTYLLLIAIVAATYISRKIFKGTSIKQAPSYVYIFLLYICSYLPFLIPGAILVLSFDRYMLPILPLVLVLILVAAQKVVARVPPSAWAVVALFAAYGIVTTHDYCASLEARYAAAKQAPQHGIPANRLSVGFEGDGWRQLQMTGHIKTSLFDDRLEFSYKHFWFWTYLTAIEPDYVAISSSADRVPKSAALVIPFRTWGPPAQQAISIVRREDIPRDQDLD